MITDDQPTCLVFAGGGTGGHLMPGLAIAERAIRLDPELDIHFICSDKSLDAAILGEEGCVFHPVPARPLVVRRPVRFLNGWRTSVGRSRRLLRELMVQHDGRVHVVAMGGYVSAPVAYAASRCGLGLTLVNLDVVPGKANRLTARWATGLVSAVACPGDARFRGVEVVGMPIRELAVASEPVEACRRHFELEPDRPTLLVTGASQGAGSLNDLLAAMCRVEWAREVLQAWQVLHLCGPGREGELESVYGEAGVSAVVVPFCREMGLAWGAVDVCLSRAGASSVAEAQANAVPTVFVPYPWHRDQHQKENARPTVERGGGWLVEDRIEPTENLETIGRRLVELIGDREILDQARENLKQMEPSIASERISCMVLARNP